MKNTIFIFAFALFCGLSVSAQSTTDSIAAKYQLLPMPQALTIEKTFPVLGSYQLTAADGTTSNVMITLDPENKGMVWIDGLPQGKIKAYLKQAPATYRIIAQKSETGKQIPEGTLIFDQDTRNLNIALGKPFDAANPGAIFNLNPAKDVASVSGSNEVKVKTKSSASKTKSKVVFYTATRSDETGNGLSTSAASQQ
jgi:hypothetical protein